MTATKEIKLAEDVEAPKPAGPIDIGSLDTGAASDKGSRIELLHPVSKEPVGLGFTVLGKHSQTFRDIVKERINKTVREQSMAAQRGKPAKLKTAEVAEAEAVELLAACTTGWDSGEGEDYWLINGDKLSFNHANAITVYTQFLWIREQVDAAIGDLENFMTA